MALEMVSLCLNPHTCLTVISYPPLLEFLEEKGDVLSRSRPQAGMMSKLDSETYQLPSYDEAIHPAQPGKQSLPNIQSKIREEILDFSVRLRSAHVQRNENLLANDKRILDILLQEIRVFLDDYISSALPKATLILVPIGVIPENSVGALDDLRGEDDFGRLVQVVTSRNEKESSWSGSDMTERLATCLQPATESVPTSKFEAPRNPKPQPETKKSFWKKVSAARADDRNVRTVSHPETKKAELPKVSMHVKAKDVICRAETPFGSYDTVSVWGLVVELHVNADREDERLD